MHSPPKVWVQGPAAKEPQAKTTVRPARPWQQCALPSGIIVGSGQQDAFLRRSGCWSKGAPTQPCYRLPVRPSSFCSVSARVIRQYPQREQPSSAASSGLSRLFLSGGGGILAEQQTLVLVQLLLTAAQINSHSSQRTSHSSQRCDNSDQTGFLHRFSTLPFGRTSGPAIFSGRSAAQARSILKLLYPDFTKITTKKAKFCFFQSPSFFLYALNAPGRVYSFCSCSRLAQTQPAGASALPTQTE